MNSKYRKHEGNNTKAHLKLLNNNDKVLKTAGKKVECFEYPLNDVVQLFGIRCIVTHRKLAGLHISSLFFLKSTQYLLLEISFIYAVHSLY